MLASPTSSRPIRWCSAIRALGHRSAISDAMRPNAFSASGSYASYSKYRTLRPMLWLRTSPRNVTTAPSELACPELVEGPAMAAVIRSTSSGSGPMASDGVTSSVYEVRLKADTTYGTWRPALAGPRRSPLPKVIQRTAAVADARRMRDGAGHVLLGARGRIV